MKSTIQFFLIFTFGFIGTGTVLAQDLTREVSALAKSWQEAYNRSDAAALGALYASEVTYVNSKDGSTSMQTKAQIEEQYKGEFTKTSGQIDIQVSGVSALPDGKVTLSGTFSGVSTNKETGEKTAFSGTYNHTAVKEDGQWKLSVLKVVPDTK